MLFKSLIATLAVIIHIQSVAIASSVKLRRYLNNYRDYARYPVEAQVK